MGIISKSRVLKVSASALAAFMLVGVPDASAQNLLERLFGGNRNREYREYREPIPQRSVQREAPQQRSQRAQAPRISGPSYNDYRADPLVRVDFKGLAVAFGKASQDQASAAPDRSIVTASSRVAPLTLVSASGVRASTSIILPGANGQPINAEEETAEAVRGTIDEAFAEDEARAAEKALADARSRLQPETLEALASFELMTEKAIADAIVAHYAEKPDFIWIEDGKPGANAREAMRVLGDAASHALNPLDYRVSVPLSSAMSPEQLARFEMELSARVLRFASDVGAGRIDPNRISGYYDFAGKGIDFASALSDLAASDDARGWLEERHPQNAQYRHLRAELSELRASEENAIIVADGTFIRPGQESGEFAKILQLIEREADQAFLAEHGGLIALNRGATVYTNELVPVIKAAQAARGLQADGIIGPRTVSAIAGESKGARIAKVELALEQLRWLPSELPDRYVLLNTPSFMASYFEGGRKALSMRAIYGKAETQTYVFNDKVSYVEFHPYWGMPRSILVNTYLPRLQRDPSYFDRGGYEVTDGSGRRIPSTSINWYQYGANIPFNVRQLPGPRNALGELKIMFPNKHAIYMHDTPDRELFARENRAISNGCVRLEDPRAMAAAVLGWDRQDVSRRLDGPHSRQNLDVNVPVFLTYFTAWPEDGAEIVYYNDVYGRDARLLTALERIASVRAPSS